MIRIKLDALIKKKGLDEDAGVSNRELARQIGISHVALYKMRVGKPYNPSLEMLDRFCNYFKCKVGDILVHSNDAKRRRR